MMHQLVLQFPASAPQDYDSLLALEERLRTSLPRVHVVDGHDSGSGEMNLFIHTENPTEAFRFCQDALAGHPLAVGLRAGYRELAGLDYTTLWPPGQTGTFKIK